MNIGDIIFIIAFATANIFSVLFSILIWKKEKRKLFQEQVKQAFDNAHKLADIYKKPLMDKLNDVKSDMNKKNMESELRLKLETEDKLKEVDNETIEKLMSTGLTRDEAIERLR